MLAVIDKSKMFIEEDTPESLSHKQIEAIKERAIAKWGDNWLAELVHAYANVTGANVRNRYAMIQRWFKYEYTPSQDSLNAMLLAVNCRFKMVYIDEREI